MNIQQNAKIPFTLYAMICLSLLLVAGTVMYLSHFTTTEEKLIADKNIKILNGPWKFITGDNMQYARPNYNDSAWETMDLTAPPGAHDGDVGLSGFIPGWTDNGHANYSGYAWYRLKISLDSLPGNSLVLATPAAVDDAYQLFINGSLSGASGDFSGTVPKAYSIQPRMVTLPENVQHEKNMTIAFRVWMSAASLYQGAGGIHIAPAIGAASHIKTKYSFQWQQTIKGYIVEVVLPVMFVLLAIAIFSVNSKRKQSYKWFTTALILVGLMRLNQAVFAWLQIERAYQSDIVGSVILRPLVLGSWLMAWREWFDLHHPKWLPKIIAILTLVFIIFQWLGLRWVAASGYAAFQNVAGYVRWLMLALMLWILWEGIRKNGLKDVWVYLAVLLLIVALYPQEISALQLIPGIWFPYGVGVSRGQFFYAFFVFVMYVVLIQKAGRGRLAYNKNW